MLAPPSTKPSGPSTVLSPAQTLVDGRVPQQFSTARRYVLLIIFCLAQFLDAFLWGDSECRADSKIKNMRRNFRQSPQLPIILQ